MHVRTPVSMTQTSFVGALCNLNRPTWVSEHSVVTYISAPWPHTHTHTVYRPTAHKCMCFQVCLFIREGVPPLWKTVSILMFGVTAPHSHPQTSEMSLHVVYICTSSDDKACHQSEETQLHSPSVCHARLAGWPGCQTQPGSVRLGAALGCDSCLTLQVWSSTGGG